MWATSFEATLGAYRALERPLAEGRVRAIGVSNFMQGRPAIPKSTKPHRIAENLDVRRHHSGGVRPGRSRGVISSRGPRCTDVFRVTARRGGPPGCIDGRSTSAYCSRQDHHWSPRGVVMSDKSPRQHMAKKQGKTIKEKRADKRDKANAAASIDPVSRAAKR